MGSPKQQQHVPRGRLRLAAVLKAADEIIQIEDASRALSVSRNEAAKLLSRWTGQGWLRRVGAGAYVPVPLDSLDSEHVLPDPWVLVPALFSPAYIGGRTAAEHWDLTEQIFRDIVVITGQTLRAKSQVRHGAQFTLKHVKAEKIFGTKPVWRGQTKVDVSDVHRTMIDMFDDPDLGAGIQHVADCFLVYLKRPDRDDPKLMQYAARLGNRAVFKRMGFLAELNGASDLAAACKERISQGMSKLDPGADCPRLITAWRLWVPSSWVDRSQL